MNLSFSLSRSLSDSSFSLFFFSSFCWQIVSTENYWHFNSLLLLFLFESMVKTSNALPRKCEYVNLKHVKTYFLRLENWMHWIWKFQNRHTHIHSTSIPQCKYNEKRFVSLSMQFLRFFRSFFFSFFCSFSSKFIFEQSNHSVRYMLYVMNIKIPNCSNTLNSIYLLSSPLGVYCVYLMKIENGNRTYKCECISRHIVTVFRLKYLS